MSEPINDIQLDGAIREFLARESRDVAAAPTAADALAQAQGRVARPAAVTRPGPGVIKVVIVALLSAALLGALVAGATILRSDDPGTTFEAIFLRSAPSGGVVVVGVDTEGTERPIAVLKDAWTEYGGLAPMGAVSPTGLLAIASGNSWEMTWAIVDLHDPDAAPIPVPDIVQDVEQLQITAYWTPGQRPGVFWGPDDRVAIPSYVRRQSPDCEACLLDWSVSLVDGPTRSNTTVDLPETVLLLPEWASDGSGVLVTPRTDLTTSDPNALPRRLLRSDGAMVDLDEAIEPHAACRTSFDVGPPPTRAGGIVDWHRSEDGSWSLVAADGIEAACIAPDGLALVAVLGFEAGATAYTPKAVVAAMRDGGTPASVEGNFAGWMRAD